MNNTLSNGSINSSNGPASGVSSNGTANNQCASINGVNVQPSTPSSNANSGMCSSDNFMKEEHKVALKQWNYCLQLGKSRITIFYIC